MHGRPLRSQVNDAAHPDASTKIVGVGDLMLAGRVAAMAEIDPSWSPFAHISSFLKDADIAFGNLETPLTDTPLQPDGSDPPRFAAPIALAEHIAEAGFDIVSLANNHILDQGVNGLTETIAALERVGVTPVGIIPDAESAQRPVILEVRGNRVGFLAYAASHTASRNAPGAAPLLRTRILSEVAHLRSQVDHVCVSVHQGHEYSPAPHFRAHQMMRAMLDAGVDIVFGHHPHVPQGMMLNRRGAVAFASLGNCTSDHTDAIVRSRNLNRAMREGNPFAARYYDRVSIGMMGTVWLERGGGIEHRIDWLSIGADSMPRTCVEIPFRTMRPALLTSILVEIICQSARLYAQPVQRTRQLLSRVQGTT